MDTLASCLLTVLAGLLAIPVAIFFLEILAAVAMPHRGKSIAGTFGPRQRLAVIVPAHNESTAVLATLDDVRAQLLPADRLLVVADNCTDDTAVISAAAGAEVIKRDDPVKRGKGYALDFAFQHLKSDPPEIVVIIDADCRLTEHSLDRLAAACAISHRPVQALDLMIAPDGGADKPQRGRVCLARKKLDPSTRAQRARTAVPATGNGHGNPMERDRSGRCRHWLDR